MTFPARLLAVLICLGSPAPAADLSTWHPNADALCLPPPYSVAETPAQAHVADLASQLKAAIAPFPSLVDALEHSGVSICLEDRTTEARGAFHFEHGLISIRDTLAPDLQLAILIHETRHLEQFTRGFCPSNDLSMHENAQAVLAMEADAQAITTLVAWAMRQSGVPATWEVLGGMPDYGDIALAFGAEMELSGDVAGAVAAAFAQWYESDERVESYYLASCSDYLDRQDRTKALPRYGLLEPDFYTTLCRLPDGRIYGCGPR